VAGLGLSFENQDWIWIAKYDSPLISGTEQRSTLQRQAWLRTGSWLNQHWGSDVPKSYLSSQS